MIDGKLKASPPGVLPPELKAAIRERAAEIKACLPAAQDHDAEPVLPLSLVVLADAIASAPRSPFLDDLAIARTARALVEVERTIRDAPPSIRAEADGIARDAMKRAAEVIRAEKYASAYFLLDNLAVKMRGMRAH